MSDISREINILSGEEEKRILSQLREEKFEIIRSQNQERQAVKMRRQMKVQMAPTVPGLLPTVAALTQHEIRSYSLSRAISGLLGGAGPADPGLEFEVSASISDDVRSVPQHGGVYVPFRLTMSGLDTKSNSTGGYLTSPRVSSNIVDALRAHAVVLRAGATFVGGLQNSFQLPTETNVLAANWVSEDPGSDVAASDPSVGARVLRPHPMQSTTSISRQLLRQSSADMNAWLAARIGKAHGLLLDQAAIVGSGISNQPLGVLNISGIGSVAVGTNGGAATAAHIVSLESTVSAVNGDTGSLAFISNSLQRSKLRSVPEMTGGALPIWRDGQMLSYPAYSSNQVPSTLVKGTSSNCSAIIFGNWNALFIGEFGGALELVVDEVTAVRQGMVELTSYAAYELGVTTLGSMAAIQDAI